ncbi:MAG: hypothetical protein HYX52_03285 [Chloroflexi bacterium]|nr:hypothetical protein [Chloroflexota bacterium]
MPAFDAAKAYPYRSGQARISGEVVSEQGGTLSNATVRLVGTSVAATADQNGRFVFPTLQTNPSNPPIYRVLVTAVGAGTIAMERVPLFDRQEIVLRLIVPPAGQTRTTDGFPSTPSGRPPKRAAADAIATFGSVSPAADATAARSEGGEQSAASVGSAAPVAAYSDTDAPPYIRIGRNPTGGQSCYSGTDNYVQVDHVRFVDYVKWVLPAEWVPSWPQNSLIAGAMLIRNYAWRVVNNGGAHGNADLDDSPCDQVYNPTRKTSATDAAVEAAFADGFNRNGVVFFSEYVDGTPDGTERPPCSAITGSCDYAGRLSQWGSKKLAEDGLTPHQILEYYYNAYTGYAPNPNVPIGYFTIKPPAPEPRLLVVPG